MVHEILAELVTAEVTAGVQVQVLEHASQKLDVFRRDRLRAERIASVVKRNASMRERTGGATIVRTTLLKPLALLGLILKVVIFLFLCMVAWGRVPASSPLAFLFAKGCPSC